MPDLPSPGEPSAAPPPARPAAVPPASAVARCEATRWGELAAYRLSNDQLEAVVVPAVGAVLHFSRPGGANWLWTGMVEGADGKHTSLFPWPNWGGDKTWLAPQGDWTALAGRSWPPDPTWGDPAAGPFDATLLPSGGLRVTGPVSARSGLRVIRDYRLDGAEWVTTQVAENISGPARTVALWSVTNVERPAASYFAPSPTSAHPGGFCEFRPGQPPLDLNCRAGLVIVKATTDQTQKLGFDTPWSALAVQRGHELLIQRAEHTPGAYPHGALGAGDSVEYYDSGTAVPKPYVEQELLGPLTVLAPGGRITLTTRWRIEALPRSFSGNDAELATILGWLRQPLPGGTPPTSH